MDNLLVTPYRIRDALAEDYTYIRDCFDPLREHRKKTGDIATEAFKGKPKACAVCGEPQCKVKLQNAHIQALAECGETTPKNLLPLCCGTHVRMGCHKLYDDDGCASQEEMCNARQNWVKGGSSPTLRCKMENRFYLHRNQPPDSTATKGDQIQHFIDKGYYTKALEAIDKRRNEVSGEKHFDYKLKRIEVLRRRAAEGCLEMATCAWKKLQASGAVPPRLTPWFYYEGGYIEMLLGRHEMALLYFDQSLKALPSGGDTSTQWLASAGLIVQTTIALKGSNTPWAEVMKYVKEARKRSAQINDIHGRRWIDNWNWHVVRIELIRGRMDKCVVALEEAEVYATKVTNLEKLDWLGIAIRRTISGAVMAKQASSACDAKRALRHLSRALVLQVGQYRKHPEMVRDLLFAIATCLQLLNMNRAKRVDAVAKRTRDGSSWFYPYRAV